MKTRHRETTRPYVITYKLSDDELIARIDEILVKTYKNILDYGQLGLTKSQYEIFRKKVFELFEGKGAKEKIRQIIKDE